MSHSTSFTNEINHVYLKFKYLLISVNMVYTNIADFR